MSKNIFVWLIVGFLLFSLYDTFQNRIEQMLANMEYLKMTLHREAERIFLDLQTGGEGMRDTRFEIPLTGKEQTE